MEMIKEKIQEAKNKARESRVNGHGARALRIFGKKTNQLEQINSVFEVDSFSKFVNKVAKIGEVIDCTNYDFGKPLEECVNKVKGDLFEVFTILWFNTNGGDTSLRVLGTKWAKRDQIGYDFTATDHFGNPVMIQSKFHANAQQEFESDRLETFMIEGNNVGKPVTRVLFTSAAKIATRYRRAHREDNMIVVDRKVIKAFDNLGFWIVTREQTQEIFS